MSGTVIVFWQTAFSDTGYASACSYGVALNCVGPPGLGDSAEKRPGLNSPGKHSVGPLGLGDSPQILPPRL